MFNFLLSFIKDKKSKFTCDCCGYETLLSDEINADNGEGEICPICFWETGYYFDSNDLFGLSLVNRLTLYQAQENYQNYGCCKKELLAKCRKPWKSEEKDPSWLSIQDKIEKKYNNYSKVENEIKQICSNLKDSGAEKEFYNYKRLHEVKNDNEEIISYFEYVEDPDVSYPRLYNKLFLKSLLTVINKKYPDCLNKLFIKFYQKGLSYYIGWVTILLFLININRQLGVEETNILLEIENNNYYGLKTLEVSLKKYWKDRGGS